MESLRKPLFWGSLVAILLAVALEVGSMGLVSAVLPNAPKAPPSKSWGIPYLALVDGLLLYVVLLTGLSLIVPERFQGRAQGVVTLVVSVLVILGGVVMIFAAIGFLLLLVALIAAVPFGTAIYLAAYSHFPTGSASAALSAVMTLKLVFAVLLVLSHQRFLQNKSLVLLTLTSFLASIIVSFLHGFVPTFLVSITDVVGALVCGILGVIWAIFFLIFSIPAVVKAVA